VKHVGTPSAARSWNQLIEWARRIVYEEPVLLDIFTNPTERPISFEGRAPDCYYNEAESRHLIEWHKPETYQLAGYQVMNFATGALERDVSRIIQEDDLFELRHFISPQSSLLLPAPLVLAVSSVVVDIAYRAAWPGTFKKRERSSNIETLPLAYHYHARTGRTWTRILEIDGRGHTERQHLEAAAMAIGVELQEAETPAAVLRRFVLHLATLETIAIAPDET